MPRSDLPGIPTAPDEDWVNGQIEALRRDMREYQASLMEAVGDAIGSSVTFDTAHDHTSAFALDGGGIGSSAILEETIAAPAGYYFAGAIATGFIFAKNTSGGASSLSVVIEINNGGTDVVTAAVASGATIPLTVGRAHHGPVNGPTDYDSLTFTLKAGGAAPWPADAANYAMLSALVTFRRNAP